MLAGRFKNLFLLRNLLLKSYTIKRPNSSHGMMSGLTEGTKYIRRDHQICDLTKDDGNDIEIELLLSPTPNGHKISILLEELGVPYRVHCIDLNGEQFSKEFLKHSPNGKIPAIIDHSNGHSVFESGSILMYLADKYDKEEKLFPQKDLLKRSTVIQWLMWQMANLGPMMGQSITFNRFAAETIPYAIERYGKESTRLFDVLDKRLKEMGPDGYMCQREGPTIADFATVTWIRAHRMAKVPIDGFDYLGDWLERMKSRPNVREGLSVGFVNTPLGREMGRRYKNGEKMTKEQKEAFMKSGNDILHEKSESLSEKSNK